MKRLMFVIPLFFALTALASVPPPPPPGATCSDFQILPFPQTFPGPNFVLGGLTFTNPTSSGAPVTMQLVDRTEDHDFRPELYVGYSLSGPTTTPLYLKFATPPMSVWVDLEHFDRATVVALDPTGVVVGSATQPTQKTRTFLSLFSQRRIALVRFEAVETLLYRVCWQ